MTSHPTSRFPWLTGPPVELPGPLDRMAERWWAARPRTRTVLVLAGLAAVLLAGVTHAASDPHGPPTSVLVAAEELRPGDRVTSAVVTRATWPAGLVPNGAVTEVGGTVAALLPAGAVVTDAHLGDGGLAAGVEPDRVAVTVPRELLPDVRAGSRLDVIGADHDGSVGTLAPDAVVVGVDEVDVWLAVPPDAGPTVSAAAAQGTIAVVIRPP